MLRFEKSGETGGKQVAPVGRCKSIGSRCYARTEYTKNVGGMGGGKVRGTPLPPVLSRKIVPRENHDCNKAISPEHRQSICNEKGITLRSVEVKGRRDKKDAWHCAEGPCPKERGTKGTLRKKPSQ